MEEFGLVMELRHGNFGPDHIRIRTHRPLAIFTPPEQYQLWKLGRDTYRFRIHRRLLAENQESTVKAIELDIMRIYVLLYDWVKGEDAENCWKNGDLDTAEIQSMLHLVTDELKQKGFRVLDNKPKHFILRKQRSDGALLRRNRK